MFNKSVSSNGEPRHDDDDDEPSEPPKAILIHCDLGISRSSTVIIAYLMRKYDMKRDDITAFVQSKAKIKPSANFTRQLQIWEEVKYQMWEDEEGTDCPQSAVSSIPG